MGPRRPGGGRRAGPGLRRRAGAPRPVPEPRVDGAGAQDLRPLERAPAAASRTLTAAALGGRHLPPLPGPRGVRRPPGEGREPQRPRPAQRDADRSPRSRAPWPGWMPKQPRLGVLETALVTLGKGDGWGSTNANASALLALSEMAQATLPRRRPRRACASGWTARTRRWRWARTPRWATWSQPDPEQARSCLRPALVRSPASRPPTSRPPTAARRRLARPASSSRATCCA